MKPEPPLISRCTFPRHCGHSVSGCSVMACRCANFRPHAPHSYSYVSTLLLPSVSFRNSSRFYLTQSLFDEFLFGLQSLGPVPESLFLQFRIGLLTRRGIHAKPHPARKSRRMEHVSPAMTATAESPALGAAAFSKTESGAASGGWIRIPRVCGSGAKSCRTSGHSSHTPWSCSISSWHYRILLS